MRNILTKIGKNWPIGEKKVLTFGVCGIVTTNFFLNDPLIVSQILWVYSFLKIGSVTNNFSALGVLTGRSTHRFPPLTQTLFSRRYSSIVVN